MAGGAAQLLAPQAPAVGKAAFSLSQMHACSPRERLAPKEFVIHPAAACPVIAIHCCRALE
jgi:hypothetical protein